MAPGTTTGNPTTRRSTLVGYSRDSVYLLMFSAMVIYHFFSTYSALILPTSATGSKGDAAFLPVVPETTRRDYRSIPLHELTQSSISRCHDDLIYLSNRILESGTNRTLSTQQSKEPKASSRIIPKIVHMTSKSRCFAPNFVENIQTWEFPDHELYIHDDDAVERLLSKQWASFPHITVARKCLRSGAGLADLWRYLVLWEYGGIYTDIDNAPGKFWTADTIAEDDDAFFVIEKLGVLSQYFMAVSPKHPLMYLAVHLSLRRLLELDHVGKQNIPVVTGPGALKVAFKYFMRTQETLTGEDELKWKRQNPNGTRYGRVKGGTYVGVGGRRVTVAGTKETASRLVVRGSVYGKSEGYDKMGMKHFSQIAKKKFNESCLVHLWNLEYGLDSSAGSGFNYTNW